MIETYLGFDSDYIILGLCGLTLLLLILLIINIAKVAKLKKNYGKFMSGKNAASLEDTLIRRLEQVDELLDANKINERNIEVIFGTLKNCFQKHGMVKYDAFDEMGGKLSFALALLDEKNNGYILNVVHNRDGCYTYIKDIIDANSVVALSGEEEEALRKAFLTDAQ